MFDFGKNGENLTEEKVNSGKPLLYAGTVN